MKKTPVGGGSGKRPVTCRLEFGFSSMMESSFGESSDTGTRSTRGFPYICIYISYVCMDVLAEIHLLNIGKSRVVRVRSMKTPGP